jgi:alkane 1-monooxygenase
MPPNLSSRAAARFSLRRAFADFAPRLIALAFPLNTLTFLLTGPHRAWVAPLFFLPLMICAILDEHSRPHTAPPSARVPALWFDALLLVLVALQVTNIVLLGALMQRTSLGSVDALMAMIVVGSSSAYSGIVVAHELIHRPQRAWQALGRLLLATVTYEHFYTEHVRGHHVRVGTREDGATARFGETFNQFFRRTVPQQFKSAWRLEAARLGDVDMRWYDPRLLRSRVVHGLAAEAAIAAIMYGAFGAAALVLFVLQAGWAIRALEVVNYFEHWGLTRTSKAVLPIHAWDADSWFTYYALTGLSRHADHHAVASRPYPELRHSDESPKLPQGYLAMFPLVIARNRRYQRLMTAELQRKQLGPFATGATAATAEPR